MHDAMEETYISVDVETAGPNPSGYSLLSIGACTLDHPQQTFYVELVPVNDRATTEALAISGLSLEALRQRGVLPAEAMARFAEWVGEVVPATTTSTATLATILSATAPWISRRSTWAWSAPAGSRRACGR
jgi:DNA polymerase III epsilon subunit-like protein